MTSILITGSTGFLGAYLIPLLSNNNLHLIVRSKEKAPDWLKQFTLLEGDITKPNLGLREIPDIDEIWNLAGVINLSKKAHKENFKVNAEGAYEVTQFALKHKLKRIVHISTAYASDEYRNPYEQSKWIGECYIREITSISTIIFRPSILIGESATGIMPKDVEIGAFYRFIARLAKMHRRIESLRKKAESKLRLPPLEPTFRLKGNPDGKLNLIPIDIAAEAMVKIAQEKEQGIFNITNPNPPTLQQLADWVGEAIKLNLSFNPNAYLSPIELAFASVMKDFLPYLQGDNLPSDIELPFNVDKEFIQKTVSSLIK